MIDVKLCLRLTRIISCVNVLLLRVSKKHVFEFKFSKSIAVIIRTLSMPPDYCSTEMYSNTKDTMHLMIQNHLYFSHTPSTNKPGLMSYEYFHFPRYHTNVQMDL